MLLWLQRNMLPFQLVFFVLLGVLVVVQPADALVRLGKRELYVASSQAGATTDYTVSFYYTTPAVVGSVDMLLCQNPIPYMPCDPPAGIDLSSATMTSQTGETGFTAVMLSQNHIVLTRPPAMTGNNYASYTFSGVRNPDDMSHSFGFRLSTYASTDATGPIINLGSVLTQTTEGVTLETQVPPILDFCVAHRVDALCANTDGVNYTDLGDLTPTTTLSDTSQFAVGTNASLGYAVTINGTGMAAGTHTLGNLSAPTPSAPGNNQFGINLRANTEPAIGLDSDGDSTNTVIAPDYNTPNKFMYKDGDVIATAPNVSLMQRYTVSYMVNSAPELRAGNYTSTFTYICTANF
jgi:hypothetical protein